MHEEMNRHCVEIWNNCLKMIRENTQPQSYKTWFEPIKPLAFKGETLTIQVPSQFFFEYLESHYVDLLKLAISRVIGPSGKLQYSIVMDNSDADHPYGINVPPTDKSNTKNPSVRIPLDLDSNDEKKFLNPFVVPGIKKINVESQLNENYSFDNFVEGECNRMARVAGMAVAKNPGKSFNPLFVFSETGLGKTHLCHAIGLETKKHHPNLIVLYVNAEQFIQQFMTSCKNKTREDFVRFYQMIDVLIIDDIQFFEGKAKTQDTLFHIFNHLHQNKKQLIFTCDKPAFELKDTEQRIISRFQWGLISEMQAPDVITRINILKRKAYNDGIEIPDEVIDYVASRVKANVREMEGLFISLMAQSSLNKKAITIEMARQLIDRFVNSTTQEISIEYIIKIVNDRLNVTMEDFLSKSKKREMVLARQLSMYFAKKYTKCSLAMIGKECGNKDHSTVSYAIRTIGDLIEKDKQVRALVSEIEKNIC